MKLSASELEDIDETLSIHTVKLLIHKWRQGYINTLPPYTVNKYLSLLRMYAQ